MEEKPSYYAIIPAEVRYDNDLRANEKLFFGEIVALSNTTGVCNASNNYFANLYGVVPSAISKWVKDLEEKEYISVEYIKNGKEIIERKITITGIHKYDKVFTKVVEGYSQKNNRGYSQKLKENNTSNLNNTSINNKEIYKEIIDYLNLKLDTHYKYTSQATQRLINARLNDGFKVEDFKKVIDNKYSDWFKDKKMNQYLRPETLFSNKFESYLNQKTKRRMTEEEILKYLEEKENE